MQAAEGVVALGPAAAAPVPAATMQLPPSGPEAAPLAGAGSHMHAAGAGGGWQAFVGICFVVVTPF